jgi:hypothetical protein
VKDRDEMLKRLFRAAAANDIEPEMPFGFDSRVLAQAHERGQNGSAVIALLARRAALLAMAIIVIAAAGVYQLSDSTNDLQSEYAMADNAIESNLGE